MPAAGNSHAEHLHFQRDATDASAFWRRPNRANKSEREPWHGRYRRSGDAEFEVPNHTSVTRREELRKSCVKRKNT